MNREAKQLPVNPKYKDTFFWMLFREKEKLMKQYMQYVERVRNYARAQGMSLDEAVSMCIFEYDEEKEMEKYKRAESLYIREELEKELRGELTKELWDEATGEVREKVREKFEKEIREEFAGEPRIGSCPG